MLAHLQFGRTAGDLAFASGNRELFAALYSAASKAKPAAPEPEQARIPPPADFWSYLQNVAPKRAGSTPAPQPVAPAAQPQAAAPPPGQPQVANEEHPRKQFEAWLGGVLFPQRHKDSRPVATGGSPYGRVDKVETPPPSVAAPAFSKLMGGLPGKPAEAPAHTVGHAGGSTFAAHRAEAAARPQVQPPTAGMENLTMGLDPYSAATPSAGAPTPAATAAAAAGEDPANPLMAMMQAMGKKAQADIKTTMKAAGAAAEDFRKQHALGVKPGVRQCLEVASCMPQLLLLWKPLSSVLTLGSDSCVRCAVLNCSGSRIDYAAEQSVVMCRKVLHQSHNRR